MPPALRDAIPGPAGSWLLGVMPRMARDPLAVLREAATLGDAVAMRVGPRRVVLLTHPDLVHHVLVDRPENYPKSPLYRKMEPAFGDGLLLSEGAWWRSQRQVVQPAFAAARVATLGKAMVEATTAMLDRWEREHAGRPFDVVREMAGLTLQIIVRTMFSAEVGERFHALSDAVDVLNEMGHRRFFAPVDWPLWLPTPDNRRFRAAMRTVEGEIQRMIAARRAKPTPLDAPHPDLLDQLLRAPGPSGSGLPPKAIRDEAMTIFLAGHETTAMALTWTWYLLARHPQAESRLHAELASTLAGREPTVADLPRLAYARMVIEESMRVYPPVWAFSRIAREDDDNHGWRIPAGTITILSPYLMHRHPRWWPEPEAFRPERFDPAAAHERPKYAYFPFSGGPRSCIGASFAMLEAQLILATVAQRFRLRLVDERPAELQPLVTLRPKGGLRVVAERRG